VIFTKENAREREEERRRREGEREREQEREKFVKDDLLYKPKCIVHHWKNELDIFKQCSLFGIFGLLSKIIRKLTIYI
jgi:hypothetical protein